MLNWLRGRVPSQSLHQVRARAWHAYVLLDGVVLRADV